MGYKVEKVGRGGIAYLFYIFVSNPHVDRLSLWTVFTWVFVLLFLCVLLADICVGGCADFTMVLTRRGVYI